MLTRADDYPVHQTPEPIAFSGTDRNFYDRFFFNGATADQSLFFAVAFGVYPHLDIMDVAVSVVLDGKQFVLRASKHMGADRLNLSVGPITVQIVKPLEQLRIIVAANESPITADLVFHARHEPIAEPRFTRRVGPRAFMDYTRMTQNGGWSGEITIQGVSVKLDPSTDWGTRDRSWGVRPVGSPDSQPPVLKVPVQFHWLWTPSNFENHVAFCHTNDDEHGRPWNRRAVVQALGGPAREFEEIGFDFDWKPGTRRIAAARFHLKGQDGEAKLRFVAGQNFYMSGIGYTHPEWSHGMDQGPLAVAHEIIDFSTLDDNDPSWMHIQALATAELEIDGAVHKGVGVLEQLFVGPHASTGMTGLFDPPGSAG